MCVKQLLARASKYATWAPDLWCDDHSLEVPSVKGLERSDFVPAVRCDEVVPDIIASSGASAQFAWEEFIYGKLRNPNTRRNYRHAALRFFDWCQRREIELNRITPRDVGQYLDSLTYSTATKKLHLSAIRHLFDELVRRHAVVLNPALSVRAERLQVLEGRTPEISGGQVRQLMDSIDTSNVVGLRDRAIIGTLIYTAVRVSAVCNLRCRDFYDAGDQYCFRFTEKAGKSREIPVRHDLTGFVCEYLDAAAITDASPESPLFRTTIRRTKVLTENGVTRGDISRMIKRRLQNAGLPTHLSAHSFRVTTITDLLSQGVPLDDVQHLAGHADPRTTRLYDRRNRQITRNIVERISL